MLSCLLSGIVRGCFFLFKVDLLEVLVALARIKRGITPCKRKEENRNRKKRRSHVASSPTLCLFLFCKRPSECFCLGDSNYTTPLP
jgi:hypothetical protein